MTDPTDPTFWNGFKFCMGVGCGIACAIAVAIFMCGTAVIGFIVLGRWVLGH
jgi:hypothetical protein